MKLAHKYRWSELARMAGLALAYALLAKVMLDLFSANGVITLVWPPSGLALAALLIGGKKYWPGIFIGALAGNLMAGSPAGVSVFIALGNTLEGLTGAWLLTSFNHFDTKLTHLRDYLWLGISGAISACVSALIGVSTLLLVLSLSQQTALENLLQWWQGDALGIFLVTPLILVWRQAPQGWFKHMRAVETIACFGLVLLVGQMVFLGGLQSYLGHSARDYWIFLFITWAAIRFGRHGVLLIVSIVSAQALLGMTRGVGLFSDNLAMGGMINFWFYTLALTVVGITLALVLEESRATKIKAEERERRLQTIFETEPECVKIVDSKGSLLEMNVAGLVMLEAASLEEAQQHSLIEFILSDYRGAFRALHRRVLEGESGKLEFEVLGLKGTRRWLETHAAPIRDELGKVTSLLGITRDITEHKQAELRIERLTHLYKALSEINQAIVRMEQQDELFPLVCRCAVNFGGMKLAWVGQLDKENGNILLVASHGDMTGYLNSLAVSSHADVPEGRGATGTALRENRPVIVNDYINDPMTASWREGAVNIGWASAAAFPIQRGGQPFAVLTVCHAQPHAFDEEAVVLLEEMSTDISFALDNFDRESTRMALEESLRLAASVYDTSSEAIMITNADNQIIAVNPAFINITGYLAEEVIGKDPSMLSSDHQDETFYQAMWHELNTTGYWKGEIWDRRKNGEIYPKWLTINTVFNEDGTIERRVAMFIDISQRREAEQLIWRQANFDALTALPNRQMFYDRLDQDMKKSHRANRPLALMFLDLDRFKEINDTLGHDMGDVLLKEAAHRLSGCVRETDTVARLGGDEFTIILNELDDLSNVERVACSILSKLAEPFHLGSKIAYVSVSIGITLYPEDATSIEALLKNADQAMYAAKNKGRNRYSYFTPTMQLAAQTRMQITNDLREALVSNQFWIAFQPIVELGNGNICKAEALIRWQHPQHGLISPAEFIPIAEDTRLIVDIGEWVFREVTKQVSIWRKSYHPEFQISINKSPVQFRDENSAYITWPDQLQQLGLPGQSIVVEITEGMLMDASDAINNKLLAFRDAGIQVSLDDFGTGYSSLSYLKKFDIDYLKIDQSFTRNLTPDSEDMALCEAIIVMAHKLDMKVIAEGVETLEQRDLLIAAGCDYGQGYFFSRPIPASEFGALLQKV